MPFAGRLLPMPHWRRQLICTIGQRNGVAIAGCQDRLCPAMELDRQIDEAECASSRTTVHRSGLRTPEQAQIHRPGEIILDREDRDPRLDAAQALDAEPGRWRSGRSRSSRVDQSKGSAHEGTS